MNNPSAFPRHPQDGPYPVLHGMTLRDYFAAAALTGLLACPVELFESEEDEDEDAYEISTRRAYGMADAMLREREKVKP